MLPLVHLGSKTDKADCDSSQTIIATMAPAIVQNVSSRIKRMSQSSADKENYAAREEEKQRLADWDPEKKPLEPNQIAASPEKKPVGQSSKSSKSRKAAIRPKPEAAIRGLG